DGFDQLRQLILTNKSVDGDEDAARGREAVGVGRDLGALVNGEILGLGARRELLQSEINGVGAVVKGGEGGVRAAGGGQQLHGPRRDFVNRQGGGRVGLGGAVFALRR